MNFGLLCDDPEAAWMMSAFRLHAGHRIVRAILISPNADQLLVGMTGVTCSDRWEDLLAADDLDAVIVGGSDEHIWEGARQLASSGLPLLVLPNISDGLAILYELSLIRDDRLGVLFPCWPHREDPELKRLHHALRAPDRPKVHYLQWEQSLTGGTGKLLSNSKIRTALFRAADLMQFLCGAADQVTALRTGGTETGAILQSVVLSGRGIPESTWVIKSAETESSCLTIHTDNGTWQLAWNFAESRWQRIDAQGNACSDATNETMSSPAKGLLERFAVAVSSRSGESHWADVLRAAEVVDAADRSLTRRRTIDLHHEALSERAIFKTQMTAMGCGLLILTLVVMVGYLVLDSLIPWNRQILKAVLLLSAAPMFLYLLVQMLLPLTRTSPSRDTSSEEQRPHRGA